MSLSISSMAVSALNANTWQQKQQALNNLTVALNAGNLPSAQQAFAALTKSSPSTNSVANPSTTTDTNITQTTTTASIGSPMDALRAALASGNIQAAQQAFAALPANAIQQTHSAQATAYSAKNTSTTAQQPQLPLAAYGSIGTNINTVA